MILFTFGYTHTSEYLLYSLLIVCTDKQDCNKSELMYHNLAIIFSSFRNGCFLITLPSWIVSFQKKFRLRDYFYKVNAKLSLTARIFYTIPHPKKLKIILKYNKNWMIKVSAKNIILISLNFEKGNTYFYERS